MSQVATGAQASTSGAFSGLLDKIVTAGTSIAAAKIQADAAKTAAQNSAASPSPTPAPAAADWRGTVATGSGITSKPWFPVAVIAGVVVLGGGLLFALFRRK